jgi:hypothetical protein
LAAATLSFVVAIPATAEFVDDEFLIQDENEPGTIAEIDASGSVYSVKVDADCVNGPQSANVRFDSDHHDSVRLDSTRARMAQRAKGNPTPVFISGDCVGVTPFADVALSCYQSRADASVSQKNGAWTGKMSSDAKSCVGATRAEFECVETACENSETVKKFGDLRNACTAGQLGQSCDDDSDCDAPSVDGICTTEVRKVQIKGRGDAIVNP